MSPPLLRDPQRRASHWHRQPGHWPTAPSRPSVRTRTARPPAAGTRRAAKREPRLRRRSQNRSPPKLTLRQVRRHPTTGTLYGDRPCQRASSSRTSRRSLPVKCPAVGPSCNSPPRGSLPGVGRPSPSQAMVAIAPARNSQCRRQSTAGARSGLSCGVPGLNSLCQDGGPSPVVLVAEHHDPTRCVEEPPRCAERRRRAGFAAAGGARRDSRCPDQELAVAKDDTTGIGDETLVVGHGVAAHRRRPGDALRKEAACTGRSCGSQQVVPCSRCRIVGILGQCCPR